MKDKILELMPRYCGVYQSGTIGELQQNAFANKLTALMCYREVRRWLLTMDGVGLLHYNIKSIPESEYDDIVELFHSEYPKGMIIQAIEQVKNEQP